VSQEACSGCGRCLPVCPAKVLSLQTPGADGWGEKRAVLEAELCLGCGVCVPVCSRFSLRLTPVKRGLARSQLGSRYLARLCERAAP
jgi:formate hydrogenlyase subunit 6/NADH:ubiquinone oxidoreductase subunit I